MRLQRAHVALIAISMAGCASGQGDPLIRVFQADEPLPCEPDVVKELPLELEFLWGTEAASLAQSFMWKLQLAGVREDADAVVMPPAEDFADSSRRDGTTARAAGHVVASYTGLAIRATDPACSRMLAASPTSD